MLFLELWGEDAKHYYVHGKIKKPGNNITVRCYAIEQCFDN